MAFLSLLGVVDIGHLLMPVDLTLLDLNYLCLCVQGVCLNIYLDDAMTLRGMAVNITTLNKWHETNITHKLSYFCYLCPTDKVLVFVVYCVCAYVCVCVCVCV